MLLEPFTGDYRAVFGIKIGPPPLIWYSVFSTVLPGTAGRKEDKEKGR